MRGNGERWEDNRFCLLEDNRKMQEHSSFRKMIFRKENAPFFRQKPRKIARNLTFRRNFPEKIIFREFPEFFRRIFRKIRSKMKGIIMRPLKIKDRCTKKKLKKSDEVIRTYDKIQTAYAEILDRDENIKSIQCNVPLEDLDEGEFTTDFLCTKIDGDILVRECVFRKKLSLPRTCKLLDISREYWLKRGVTDWGIVIEKEEKENEEE